jgi:hypothetical protein
MEPKILAATLATLATVFAGLNGGAFTVDDIRSTELADEDLTQQSRLGSFIPEIPFMDRLSQKPEPTSQVKARIQIQDESKLKLRKAEITPRNMTVIQTNQLTIESDEELIINGYTGDLELGNTTGIQGRAQGISTSGVNISTGLRIDTETETERLKAVNTTRSELNFPRASIQPTQDSEFGITTDNAELKINSFTGNIEITPGNKTLVIDGRVDTLSAGKYELSTE